MKHLNKFFSKKALLLGTAVLMLFSACNKKQEEAKARADAENDIAVLRRGSGNCEFLGIFSLKAGKASVPVPELHDGNYEELISGKSVRIIAGNFDCSGEPAIIKVR